MIMLKQHKAASLIEYAVLIVILLSALYVMKGTLERGVFAKHKSAGDSFAFGRQYDVRRTAVCKKDVLYDAQGSFNNDGTPKPQDIIVYNEECYQARVRNPQSGCPHCDPGDANCLQCEDKIKQSCSPQVTGDSYCMS